MNKQIKIAFSILVLMVLTLSLASAMTITSVSANNFQPGSQQDISAKIKNTLGDDATSISLSLGITTQPFSVISSDSSIDSLNSDDSDTFHLTIKASNEAKAGDYSIPYTLFYTVNDTRYPIVDPKTEITPVTGTITLTVEADPELSYTTSTETPIVGSQGKIKLTIVNKGLGDAKFFSVKIVPQGYTLLSSDNQYIGTVSSDDTQTASFDVLFNQQNPTLTAQIDYKDFNNQEVTKTITLPLTVYSQEQALQLGIIKPNNTPFYLGIIVVGIIGWIVVRKIRKKKRLNKAQGR